jgi:tripartite-type tricarboxylate transporter receptor subunit TctC
LLIPSPPGGPSDFVGRLIAPKLSELLGQNVVVDTRQSVNGVIATELAARSAPDGLTLAIGNNGTHVINASLYKKLPYDPVRDFIGVSALVTAGSAFVASPKLVARNFQEFVVMAKKEPGRYNVAIAGGQGQISTAVLKHAAGIKLNDIPYKGSAPSEIAIMSNEVDVAFLSVPVIAAHVRAGKMKALGVGTLKRSALLPEVATLAEQGLTGFEFGNWHGLFVPAGTPDRIVRRLNREVHRTFDAKEIRDLVINRGSEIIVNTPEEFGAKLKADVQRFRKIMQEAGVPQL